MQVWDLKGKLVTSFTGSNANYGGDVRSTRDSCLALTKGRQENGRLPKRLSKVEIVIKCRVGDSKNRRVYREVVSLKRA